MRIAGMEMGQSIPSACTAFEPLLPAKVNLISTKAKDTTRAPLKPHIGKWQKKTKKTDPKNLKDD